MSVYWRTVSFPNLSFALRPPSALERAVNFLRRDLLRGLPLCLLRGFDFQWPYFETWRFTFLSQAATSRPCLSTLSPQPSTLHGSACQFSPLTLRVGFVSLRRVVRRLTLGSTWP